MSNRQYTHEEVEEAYQYWAYDSEDSYKNTSQYLEIPERTVRFWGLRDTWRERKSKELADLADPAMGLAQIELKLGMSALARQLIKDGQDPKNTAQDRREATKLAFSLASGLLQDEKIGGTYISLTDARQIHLQEGMSPSDLRKAASSYLEANVNKVHDNSRGPKRIK